MSLEQICGPGCITAYRTSTSKGLGWTVTSVHYTDAQCPRFVVFTKPLHFPGLLLKRACYNAEVICSALGSHWYLIFGFVISTYLTAQIIELPANGRLISQKMICYALWDSSDLYGLRDMYLKAELLLLVCFNSMTCCRAVILNTENAVFAMSILTLVNWYASVDVGSAEPLYLIAVLPRLGSEAYG